MSSYSKRPSNQLVEVVILIRMVGNKEVGLPAYYFHNGFNVTKNDIVTVSGYFEDFNFKVIDCKKQFWSHEMRCPIDGLEVITGIGKTKDNEHQKENKKKSDGSKSSENEQSAAENQKEPAVEAEIVLPIKKIKISDSEKEEPRNQIENVNRYSYYQNYDEETYVISKYTKTSKKPILPSVINNRRVTVIRKFAFTSATSIETITITSNIVTIEESAFLNRRYLKNVFFENGIKTIGGNAFFGSSSLKNIDLPSSVSTIEEAAFANCSSLESINVTEDNLCYASVDGVLFNKDKSILIQCPGGKTGKYVIPKGVKSISPKAFFGCDLLEEIVFNEELETIDDYAFESVPAFQYLDFPPNLTTIGFFSFLGCPNINEVFLHKNIKSIKIGAFAGCPALEKITVCPENKKYTSIDGVLFNKDKEVLAQFPAGRSGTYHVPQFVKTIQSYAFLDTNLLSSLFLPTSIETFSSASFYENRETVIKIEEKDIPPHWQESWLSCAMTVFDYSADMEKESLDSKYLKFERELPFSKKEDGGYSVVDVNPNVKEIVVPNFYKGVPVTHIDCMRSSNLERVIFPRSIKKIESFSLRNNQSLRYVFIPQNIRDIGRLAFEGCPNVVFVCESKKQIDNIEEDWTHGRPVQILNNEKEDLVFKLIKSGSEYELQKFNNANLTSITIPKQHKGKDVTSIASYAFLEAFHLEKIVIPETVTKISDYAFIDCPKLKKVVVEGLLDKIGVLAFGNCVLLQSIILTKGVKEIGSYAFENCRKLITIKISKMTQKILGHAFVGCENLTIVSEYETKPQSWSDDWHGDRPIIWNKK